MDDPQTALTTRRPRGLIAVGAVLVAVLGACSGNNWDPAPVYRDLLPAERVSTLSAADDCEDLADAARPMLERTIEARWSTNAAIAQRDVAAAAESAGGDGFASDSAGGDLGSPTAPPSAAGSAPATTAAGRTSDEDTADDSDPSVIGTNTQEVDVDEADLVKTDGRRIVSIVDGVLRVVQLDGTPAVDGSVDLRERMATEMFLRDDEAVVIGTAWGGVMPLPTPLPTPMPGRGPASTPGATVEDAPVSDTSYPAPPFDAGTTLTRVSLADPAKPEVVETTSVEGSYVSARMIDGRVRVVVQSQPQIMTDVFSGGPDDARAALRELRGEDLLPRAATGDEVSTLGGCDDVLLMESVAMPDPAEPTIGDVAVDVAWPEPQLGTVTAVTIGDTLADLAPVSVQGNAETVYASATSLYVAAGSWDTAGTRTDVHRFDLTGDGGAVYTGSGRTPGHLLNQFSLSERGGALRVVTTVADPQFGSSARLTVLDTDGDTLDEIGHLDGMGLGEQVKSVRFLEDLGYVVTFRTTDPLYALDLSDPTAPRLLGELKIPGFSEYLHPIGDGMLLGVGREADPETGTDTGFKISLFDVSDPLEMAEVDQIVIPEAWSQVSGDHKAFLWDARRAQAVIPVDRTVVERDYAQVGSAMVVRVVDGRLRTVAELSHETPLGTLSPMRSMVVDDDLWTLSAGGLGRSSADSPAGVDLIGF